jgi:hypothetical protein
MSQTPHDDTQPLDAPEPWSEPRRPTTWTRLRAALAGAAVAALVAVGLGGFAVGRATADDGDSQQPGFQQPGFPGGQGPGGGLGTGGGQGPGGGQLPGAPAQGGGTTGSNT